MSLALKRFARRPRGTGIASTYSQSAAGSTTRNALGADTGLTAWRTERPLEMRRSVAMLS